MNMAGTLDNTGILKELISRGIAQTLAQAGADAPYLHHLYHRKASQLRAPSEIIAIGDKAAYFDRTSSDHENPYQFIDYFDTGVEEISIACIDRELFEAETRRITVSRRHNKGTNMLL
ncbi:MAG: hypothetical protein M2R45_03816 [Verrucomicrobia subdivision 3 bacterium]|nr:hypothetical protein [Limisphaerales bacterium]MCS1415772.1 hypothetical protein [Limisphaerales bacterium]